MSSTLAARRLHSRARGSLNHLTRISTRGLTSRTEYISAPAMMIRRSNVEFGMLNNMASHKPPASGWRKCIVSSSSTAMHAMNVDPPAPIEEVIPFDQAEFEKTSKAEDFNLQVDMEELTRLASMRCTPLRLRDMYKYAVDVSDTKQRLLNSQFLHRELPIRIAQRAKDLLTLPHGLSNVLAIQQVAHIYLLYLEKFQECPMPTTQEEEDQFTEMLQSIVLDRSSIPSAIASGVDKWLAEENHEVLQEERLQDFEQAMYRFFTARVGLRFLTEHHILSSPTRGNSRSALRNSQSAYNDDAPDFLGCIQTDCCPLKEIKKVVESVTRQTEEFYGVCPEIELVSSPKNKESKFTYVPHHLHYMVGELLKNSCRSTVQAHFLNEANGENKPMSTIRVVIVKGKNDVTIKIEDKGGGIPRSKMSKIWKFAHSTAGADENATDFGVDEATGTKIRGFGLPLARIYARYFGGELTLKSMEGYGVDAYLHLPRLGDACENLPLSVQFSPGELYSDPPKKATADNKI